MSILPVTIGIPTRNSAARIQECLNSILNQSHQEFKLLVSDNGSTDDTFEICDAYAKKDARLCVYRQEKNLGMDQNFKFLLDKAETDLFCWRADDDITSDTWLALLLAEHAKYDDIVVAFSDINYSFDGVNADLNHEINFPKDPVARLRKMFIEPHISGYRSSIFGLSRPERRQAAKDSERYKCGFYGLWKTQYLKDTWARLPTKYETNVLHATDFLLMFGVVLDGTFSFIEDRAFTKRILSKQRSYNAEYDYHSKFDIRMEDRKIGLQYMKQEIARRNFNKNKQQELLKLAKLLCTRQVVLGSKIKFVKWWLLAKIVRMLGNKRDKFNIKS